LFVKDNENLRAVWKGKVLAESDDIVTVEGNAYFPAASLDERYFEPSNHRSICPWKGRASYLTVVADGERNENAAWYYPQPLPPARRIEGRVAFWKGIRVEGSRQPVG
jgi:uncharacterized protein (DUF427 family)